MRVVGIAVDDRQHAREVWDKIVRRRFTILSDPGARIIRRYGLLHAQGGLNNQDIAIDSSVLIDKNGREVWRRVSATLADLPSAKEILDRLRHTGPL